MTLHTRPTRREFVRSVTAILGAGIAGCTSGGRGLDGSQPEDTPISRECEREHQELPDLVVHNEDVERHTVELVITGEREDGSSEPFFEDTYDLRGGRRFVRAVAFDPDADEIERYDDLVARVSTEDGRSDTESVYSTVVDVPLRYGLEVRIDPDGVVHAEEMHVDTGSDWEPAC